jgi:hypothetical protein
MAMGMRVIVLMAVVLPAPVITGRDDRFGHRFRPAQAESQVAMRASVGVAMNAMPMAM